VTDNGDALDQGRALQVAQRLVQQGVIGGPLQLLRSGSNHVFRAGELVLRISEASGYRGSEIAVVQRLAEAGVPVLSPRADLGVVEGVWATLWDYIEPDLAAPVDFAGLGRGIARLHAVPAERLADVVPLPWYAEASWLRIEHNLELAATTGILSEVEVAALRQVCEELRGWDRVDPGEPVVVCHGDVHPANVLMHHGQPVIIDWDLICLGPAAWDHAALLTWPERWGGGPTDYSDFAMGYGKDFSDDPLARRLARVRLIGPTINMIRLGASDERARRQAKTRMRYWMGDPDAPQWTPL